MSISLVHLRIELSKNHKLSTDIEYSGKKVSVDLIIIIIITLFIEGNKFSEITLFCHLALRTIHIKALKTFKTF